ncbi:MAG: twin-arginine translocase subunit TatC [Proteobacteria bacterium]|nr:twin-arginine translocase subunit TatC [Pseudomonadota bacterium]
MSDTTGDTTSDTGDIHKMPLLDHLIELRQRMLYSFIALFVAFLICFFFAQTLFDFLVQPLADILIEREGVHGARRLIFTDLTEVFFTHIKIAFFFGAFASSPIFLTQLWLFIAPGLYRNEKTALAPFLVASPVLFFMGGALVYFVLFPLAWRFFLSFETMGGGGTLPIELEAKVSEYLSLVMKLIFAFGLCFQLPVLMTLLARVGIASSKGMAEKRKYAVVGVFIVAAVITPPDPISQLSLAIPIIVLYEISILMAKLVEKKRAKQDAEVEAEYGGDDDDET